MNPYVAIALNCLAFVGVGALVGAILRRHPAIAVILSSVVALAVPVAKDYVAAGFPVHRGVLYELVAGLAFAAAPLALFTCLPAVLGAVLVIVTVRRARGS